MNETKKVTLPKLFDKHGKLVEDLKTIPSGTSLRNDCGSYFVVFREGDRPTTKPNQHNQPCGPQFI